MISPNPGFRIGDLARRTGISEHVLRAWEKRYHLLAPARSSGGYRLYGVEDERRVVEMLRLRDGGMPAAQAAALVLQHSRGDAPREHATTGTDQETLVRQLVDAAIEFDEPGAQAALDLAFQTLSVEQALSTVVLPALREVGSAWAASRLQISHEHFLSHLVRRRLSALTLAWDSGPGALALLACPGGETHDLGLLAFSVVLGRAGWRVRFLGADTPIQVIGESTHQLKPGLLVLSGVRSRPLRLAARAARDLPQQLRAALAEPQFVLAGAGATAAVARDFAAAGLPPSIVGGDIVTVSNSLRQPAP